MARQLRIQYPLISKYPVSGIAPFTFLTPLFGVASGGLLLGEPLTPMLVCALTLVGTGIYLINAEPLTVYWLFLAFTSQMAHQIEFSQ